MKTATISLRVPINFKNELTAICKSKDITMSDYCLTKLTPNTSVAPVNALVLQKLASGGQFEDIDITSEFAGLLSITGGAFVGVIVYKTLKNHLQTVNPTDWSEEKIELVSFVSALASGLISGQGINQLVKVLQK